METAQVGGRTRVRAALAMAAASSAARTPKRRKIASRSINEEELKFSPTSSLVQLNSRNSESRSGRVVVIKTETATLLPQTETEEERCSSPTSVDDEFPASCCSSNGSIELDEERIKFLDLEVESAQVETSTCNCGDEIERRREMSPLSELRANSQELDQSAEANSRRLIPTAQKMPTELELEEFFSAAEKDIQKQFEKKYNYDIVKDVPLEGRYEWVQLKP